MDKAPDLRIQKTHKALVGAFLELLEQKRFENITVNEICDLAMVRRATFYKHFGDKYEFFTFLVRYTRSEFSGKCPQTAPENPQIEPYVRIIRDTMDFMDENQVLVQSVTQSSVYPILLNIVSEQIALGVREQLRQDAQKGMPLLLSPDLMAQVYTGALISFIRWWLSHREQTSKEEILEQVTRLILKLSSSPPEPA